MRLSRVGIILLTTILLAGFLALIPVLATDDGSQQEVDLSFLATRPHTAPKTPTIPTGGPFVEDDVAILYDLDGENIGDAYGWIGRQLDDLDGDGVSEFLITAPWYITSTTLQGRVYIYSGATGNLITTHEGTPFTLLGYSARRAGDVNNDMMPDYVVGAPIASKAFVFSGADHTVIHELSRPGEGFGSGVGGPGDVNADGYDDVFVGASSFDAGLMLTNTGKVYMMSGFDGSELWSVVGEGLNNLLGDGAGVVGDLNADGVSEVIAAARGFNGFNGKAYVYDGTNGNVLCSLEPSIVTNSGTYGVFFVSGEHDVNMDGLNDIYVGDYGANAGNGRAYVYSGDASMGCPELYALDGGTADGFGVGRLAPDVNGDTHADMVIASWTANASATLTGSGRVDVYSGADGSILHTVTGAIAGDALGVDALWLGDLNSDGNDEYMVTGVGLDFGFLDVGHAYVISFDDATAVVFYDNSITSNNQTLLLGSIILLLLLSGIALLKYGRS